MSAFTIAADALAKMATERNELQARLDVLDRELLDLYEQRATLRSLLRTIRTATDAQEEPCPTTT